MPTTVQHDRATNTLHLIFTTDRIIARSEWLGPQSKIDLASDGEPLQIHIYAFYTQKVWPLTEELVAQYGLEKHLEDLRLVWEAFFAPPNFAVKVIKKEGPDGNEIVYRPGEGWTS